MTTLCGIEVPYTETTQADGKVYACNKCKKVYGITWELLRAHPFQVLDWLEHHAEQCAKDGTGTLPGSSEVGGVGGGGADIEGAQEEVARGD